MELVTLYSGRRSLPRAGDDIYCRHHIILISPDKEENCKHPTSGPRANPSILLTSAQQMMTRRQARNVCFVLKSVTEISSRLLARALMLD